MVQFGDADDPRGDAAGQFGVVGDGNDGHAGPLGVIEDEVPDMGLIERVKEKIREAEEALDEETL